MFQLIEGELNSFGINNKVEEHVPPKFSPTISLLFSENNETKINKSEKKSWSDITKEFNNLMSISAKLEIKSSENGTSGVYFISNAVFKGVYKPVNEAAESKDGIPKEQEAFRERVGYLISNLLTNHMKNNGFSLNIKNFGVPATNIVSFPKTPSFEKGIGSFQKFKNGTPIEDCSIDVTSKIEDSEFLKLLLMDLLILNVDRHLQNIFVSEKYKLILIDQGSTFPQGKWFKQKRDNGSNLLFDWIYFPFTENKIPEEWRRYILSLDPEQIYKIITKEIETKQKYLLEISGEAIFNSISSLIFIQEWIKTNGEKLPVRELLRCYIAESIWYVYSIDKNNGEIKNMKSYPCSAHRGKMQVYANQLDDEESEGSFQRFTTNPIFLDVVRDSWTKFSEENCASVQNGKSRKPKRKTAPFNPDAKFILQHLDAIKFLVNEHIDRNQLTVSTDELAKEKFEKSPF